MSKSKILLIIIFSLIAGILIGGYAFSKTQRRDFVSITNCQDRCFKPNEFLGLLASVGIQNLSGVLPSVIKETDKTIAFKAPKPVADIHYIIVPKKDIKNAGEMTADDKDYIADAYAVMTQIIKEQHLNKYKIITNGPGYQQVSYLHFHLIAEKE